MTIAEADARIVPSWLTRSAAIGWRVLVTVALGLVVLAILVKLSTTTVSVIVAFIAAATLAPYVGGLRRRGWSNIKAALAVTGGAILAVIGTVIVLALALSPFFADLADRIAAGVASVEAQVAALPLGDQVASVMNVVERAVGNWFAGEAAALASTLGTVGTVAMLAGFLTFFLLLDGDKAWAAAVRGFDPWRRERVTIAGRDAVARSGGYLRGTAVLAATRAITDFVYMIVLGVPLAGPLAVLVFLGSFIPYVGGFVSTLFILLVAAGSGGLHVALILLILIVVTSTITSNVLRPVVYGRTVHLHPAVVLIALPVGATLAGIVGLFIAVPTVAFLAAIASTMVEVLGDPDPDEQTRTVPLWLDRLGQWSWRLLVAIALSALVIAAAATVPLVLGPVVVAITVAATFMPALEALKRRGIPRGRAVALLMAVLWISVILITIFSIAALADQATIVGGAAVDGAGTVDGSSETTTGPVKAVATGVANGIVGTVAAILSGLGEAAVFFMLTVLLSFYFLKDGHVFWAKVMSPITSWRRREFDKAGERAVTVLGGYMIATGVLGLFNAVTGFIIMVLLGLPLALPIAVLSFFGGFIPYIGQFLTSLLAFFVAVAFGTSQDVVIMGLYTIVMNVVQGSFIAPLVYGRAVNIHPAIVLMAIPAGGELAGVIGMFLAVPVIGVAAAVWRYVLRAIGDRPTDTVESDADAVDRAIEAASPSLVARPAEP